MTMTRFSDLYHVLLIFALVTGWTTLSCPGSPVTGGEVTRTRVIKGIDVSHFSGGVDWHKVKSGGYTFAFAKASEGVDLKDRAFQNHWQEIKKAGLIRGAYHFYVTEDDPKDQADFFIKNVPLRHGDFRPAVDIESIGKGTNHELAQRLKKFLDLLEKHYGVKPIIYTGPKFWNNHLNNHFGAYPLWIAEYGVKEPLDPKGWKEWHLWQWKENAAVPGVEKGADLSIFNHKEKDFSSLLLKKKRPTNYTN
jgi:lysozyme